MLTNDDRFAMVTLVCEVITCTLMMLATLIVGGYVSAVFYSPI